ncbi:Snf7-domain-containing protein [Gigaspora margarita]|uniref:Snf7-domain-containing protein n=1 Tax=Gigaspora margarita TaxID=4874 RepID=A0A8H3XEQ8_GIGMA|nr:Snf7-domain-containing protein [Gigaspora margarita]
MYYIGKIIRSFVKMGNKTSKITSQDRAILDLKIQRDKLIQYQKKLQVISDKETEIAKKALRNGNKRGALLALKKKKYQEQLLKKTDTQLLNLEELTQSIEFALVEKDVLSGLELGNNILKEIHKEMTIEKVEKLMEDTTDAIAYQNEIEELLSGKITREDEDEILEELRQIEEEQVCRLCRKLPDTRPGSFSFHRFLKPIIRPTGFLYGCGFDNWEVYSIY